MQVLYFTQDSLKTLHPESLSPIMVGTTTVVKALPVLAASALASVNYPPIPQDLTTPFQQRLAVYGPNGEIYLVTLGHPLCEQPLTCRDSCLRGLEHLQTAQQQLRGIRYIGRQPEFSSLLLLPVDHLQHLPHLVQRGRAERVGSGHDLLL